MSRTTFDRLAVGSLALLGALFALGVLTFGIAPFFPFLLVVAAAAVGGACGQALVEQRRAAERRKQFEQEFEETRASIRENGRLLSRAFKDATSRRNLSDGL
jgi:Flp pilus assembly protein TadB